MEQLSIADAAKIAAGALPARKETTVGNKKWTQKRVDDELKETLYTDQSERAKDLARLSELSQWGILELDQRQRRLSKFWGVATAQPGEVDKPILSAEEVRESALLGKGDIVKEFQRALETLGFIADDFRTRALMHTVYSRLSNDKVGWLHYGRSRSGKSAGLECAFRLIHPTNRMRATSMTIGALYELGHIDHRFILGGELRIVYPGEDDNMQQTLRQFISEKEMTHHRLEEQNGVSGKKYESTKHTVSGYASIAWTSTKEPDTLNDEFASRLLSVKSNEDPDTTDRCMRLKAERAMNPVTVAAAEEEIIRRFNNFDLSLKPFDVRIPFAKAIVLKNSDTSARGIYSLLLQHVAISALIHQHNRSKTEDGQCIEATREDYEAAHELVSKGGFQVLNTISSAARAEHKRAVSTLPNGIEFTQTQIIDLLRKPKSTVQGWLRQWSENDMVEVIERSGRKFYKLLECECEEKSLGLILPENAFRKIEESQADYDCPTGEIPKEYNLYYFEQPKQVSANEGVEDFSDFFFAGPTSAGLVDGAENGVAAADLNYSRTDDLDEDNEHE